METMTSTWNDERLDEFGKRVDERFDRVDERLERSEARSDESFDRVDERFTEAERVTVRRFEEVLTRFDEVARGTDKTEELMTEILNSHLSVQRSMVAGAIALTGGFMAGFAPLIVLIAALH